MRAARLNHCFSLGYQKNMVEGKTLYVMNPVFIEELKKRKIYSEQLLDKVVKNGGILLDIEEIPEEIKESISDGFGD